MPSLTAIVTFALLASIPQLPPFEPNSEFRASEILPLQQVRSDDHVVNESVSNDGFMNHYVIETTFGNFEAEGDLQLARVIQEAHALAELDRVSTSGLYIDAAKNIVLAPVAAVTRIVEAPVETVKGIPSGVARKFRSLGRSVKRGAKKVAESVEDDEPEEGVATDESVASGESGDADETGAEAEESENKTSQYAKKWFGVTSSQRRWAQKLGVDPYSGNTVMQEKMAAVAKVDATANFAAKLVTPDLGAIGYVVDVSNLVWSLDGEELRDYNLEQLEEAGISKAIIEDFLDYPAFSPTQQTVITQAMLQMQDIDGLGEVLRLPDWVANQTEAWFYTDTIQLMARFSESMQRPRAIVGISKVPALLTDSDELIYVVPVDYLTWNKNLAGFIKDVMAPPVEAGEGGRATWLSGMTTQTAAVGLTTLGWSIKTSISQE